MEIVVIVLILVLISLINAINFYLLVDKKIPLKEVFRLTSVATALNRVLFTGSGYLTSSYFCRNKNLSPAKALSAFFLLEFFPISLWLILGVYFGGKLAIKVPLVFIGILSILVIVNWRKKNRCILLVKNILEHFREMRKGFFLIIPFVIFNIALLITYYFFLFKLFSFHPDILSAIKIISLSFTLGYLSPAPGGLGFKEAGMVFLLMENGLTVSSAMLLAILDRVLITAFWVILASLLGFDLIKNEIKKRFKRKNV